jgi:hypothetical protein
LGINSNHFTVLFPLIPPHIVLLLYIPSTAASGFT